MQRNGARRRGVAEHVEQLSAQCGPDVSVRQQVCARCKEHAPVPCAFTTLSR